MNTYLTITRNNVKVDNNNTYKYELKRSMNDVKSLSFNQITLFNTFDNINDDYY